jgi:curved DNA-binding protein CbpA
METELLTSQLYDACHTLFGPEINVSIDFLNYLQIPGLKAIYRKKALETHPDRAIFLTHPVPILEERFKQISTAYKALYDYLENPLQFKLIDDSCRKERHRSSDKMHSWPESKSSNTDSTQTRYKPPLYRGAVPKRGLLFGQYIYYNGFISYRQLIDAIIWQRYRRPLIGDLAVRWACLYEEDVKEILNQRLRGEKFGESALRGGYLTQDTLRIILWRQRMLQPRIGQYFVERNILSKFHIENILEKFRQHNKQHILKRATDS